MSRHRHGCQRLGFLTCAQMLMHVIAHGGCSDTERESALDVDSGRKMLCCAGDSTPFQYCTWLFSQTLYQWSYAPTGVIIKACQEKGICSWVHFFTACPSCTPLATCLLCIALCVVRLPLTSLSANDNCTGTELITVPKKGLGVQLH